jgi:hypothetical protein
MKPPQKLRLPLGAAMLAAGMLASALRAAAPPLPSLAPGDGLGLNLHSTYLAPGQLEMIAAAGFKWIRLDLFWDRTEKQKGTYDFTDYDHFLAALEKQKMRALFILDYGNPLYADPGEKWPYTHRAGTQPFRDAYSKWAAAVVSHFAGRGCIWEIWNEPNYKNFWQPAPNVAEYVALAKAAAASIHQAAPKEPLIGPACSQIKFDFLEACFQGGLLEDWSAVSVHPYRRTDPSTVAAEYDRLHELIAQYAPPGRTIPIISSEWGYSTAWPGFDDQKQAAYLVGEFSTNIANHVPLSIWYDWHDDGVSADDPEHRFGMVHHDYHPGGNPVYDPKPAYQAMKDFATQLQTEKPNP